MSAAIAVVYQPRGCYCRIGGFFDGWHLRGAPDCVAAAETQLEAGQLYLFDVVPERGWAAS